MQLNLRSKEFKAQVAIAAIEGHRPWSG